MLLKHLMPLILVLSLILLPGPAPAAGEDISGLLPQSSLVYSPPLARACLALASGYTAADQRRLAEEAGFTVTAQRHFDKDPSDPAHTCAYTVGVYHENGSGEEIWLVLIRGTAGSEWHSNFDVSPLRREDSPFAENFLFCAEDVFLDLLSLIGTQASPRILICGHSRGAACANILGVLLNAVYGPERVYAYTSATPATVKASAAPGLEDRNIFNLINPQDLVPRLPPEAWGYVRFGTDILPPGPGDASSIAEEMSAAIIKTAPTVGDYYSVRHSLTRGGTDPAGMTAFDLMLVFSDLLAGLTSADAGIPAGSGAELLSPDSDFAPLIALLDEKSAAALLTQHLPDTYMALFFGEGEH